MKLLHVGDLHLGKTLNDFDLIDDQRYLLQQILDLLEERQIRHLLLAGDIYDKAVPSEGAVHLFDWFIRELANRRIQTYIISGNHDSDERLEFGSSLFEESGIHIAGTFLGTMKHYRAEDEYGPVNLYLLPFIKRSQAAAFYPDEKMDNYDDALRVVIEQAEVNTKERNVILAHQFVAGRSRDPELAGSENVGVRTVGTIEKISADRFDAFDYAALGHIHSPQRVGRDTVRYAGSLMKYSVSEADRSKSVVLVTLGEKGQAETELLPLRPKRDLRHIKGTLRSLIAHAEKTEDFIYATLLDEDTVDNALEILRSTYPNVIKLDYDNARTRQAAQPEESQQTTAKSFQKMIRDFYEEIYGVEMSEEEMRIMRDAAGEAGVWNEAD